MRIILVAGANGVLGKQILEELNERGQPAYALVRDVKRLGRHQSFVQRVHIADARDASSLKGACEGVDAVISTIGASQRLAFTKDQSTFFGTNYQANRNLLHEALRAGVKKFVYISLCEGNTTLKGVVHADAHEALVDELQKSGLDYAVIRPTGFFALFEEILRQARRGRFIMIGEGGAKTNPVHERDVAVSCVDALASSEKEIDVGGPEIFTRKEIVEMGFEVLAKKPRISSIPAGVIRVAIFPVRFLDRRLYDLVHFSIATFSHDLVAPRVGKYRLRDYLEQLAAAK